MTDKIGKSFYEYYHGRGRSRYVVRFYDGIQEYKDGSPLFGIEFFASKPKKAAFIQKLLDQGYTRRPLHYGPTILVQQETQ